MEQSTCHSFGNEEESGSIWRLDTEQVLCFLKIKSVYKKIHSSKVQMGEEKPIFTKKITDLTA